MLENREVRLRQRPQGLPTADCFELVATSLPTAEAGQILVRNIYMSVDPYMRGRMADRASYTSAFKLGEALSGGCVGQVIESHHPNLEAGDYVLGSLGWREHFVATGDSVRKIDPALAPLRSYLGIMGMPGMTAYTGLLNLGQPQPGETVFVSGAAGAVGAAVCQIARLKGCYVIGSAGSAAKLAWLREEAGVSALINYKETDDLRAALTELAPRGVDVYFDNVGGDHLEAAIGNMNMHGRIVCCGMISGYNATAAACAPRNLMRIVGQRLRLEGFIVSDFAAQREEFEQSMAAWMANGLMRWQETIVEGLEQAPDAFIGLFSGQNIGKMLVQLAPDPTLA